MDSIHEALRQQRIKNDASSFAGFQSTLHAARASLAQPKDDEASKQQEIPNQAENTETEITTPPNAHNTAATNTTDETSPNTKSVMFEHLKEQQQDEQKEQPQQQDEKIALMRGLGNHQHEDKREQDTKDKLAKMRENPDLLLVKYYDKPELATARELLERLKDESDDDKIEFLKNAVNYTQSVETAKKQGKSEAAFMKELGLPFSLKNERLERLRKQYMENQKSLDYDKRNAHLKDMNYYNEIQEAFDGVDNSGIAGAPFKFVSGLLGFASDGSIPVTRDQSADEQMLALQDIKAQNELMRHIRSLKSNFKEESTIDHGYYLLTGNDDALKENKDNAYKRILENLQKEMPEITNCGEMDDGRFFIDYPDTRLFFKDGMLDYLDTTIANNQMEVGLAIAASMVALPAAAYAGLGALGTFAITTVAGAVGSGVGAFHDFNRIAANNPIGTYTSEDRNAKITDAVVLSILGDTILGGAIYGAKAAWRAIPTAEKQGKKAAKKLGFFSDEVDSILATQRKFFTIDEAKQSITGALVHGRVKDEGFLNRLEVGMHAQSVSHTAKNLGSVMNDTIANRVFDTNKKAQELFDSVLRGDHNRVAQFEKDLAEITQGLKSRFDEVEKIIKDNVPLQGAFPESFIEQVERDVARTISANDSRLHSALSDIFGLMRNAGNAQDLIEIEKLIGQALVENYKHYSAKKILNHLQYNVSKTIDDSIRSAFKSMPELGENLIKERAALKAEWRSLSFSKSRIGYDEMTKTFREHQNLDNFVHAAQANVTHDDVAKGFAAEPQMRTSYSVGTKEMSESELENLFAKFGESGRENAELIVLNGIVEKAKKTIGKDFVIDNATIYNELKSINPDLFKSEKGKQAYKIIDELATQFKHNLDILKATGREGALKDIPYWGKQQLVFRVLSKFINSLRARFSEEAGFRYCLQVAMERPRSFKEIGEILAEQSNNPKLTPQDKRALLETSKLMLKTWQEREKEIAKAKEAEREAKEALKKEKLAKEKANLLRTSGDDIGEDILPQDDIGIRVVDSMIFVDKDKGYPATYQIVDSNELSTSFEYGVNYQFREVKQPNVIQNIRDHFNPQLLFNREGGFDGLPLVDNKGRAIIGNHRLEALQHLDDATWEIYAKEVFLKYGAKIERGELLVRVLSPDVSLRERIAIAKAGNDRRANTNTERSLIIIGKYAEPINHLINGKSPVQPSFKDAANVNEMRALVAAAMGEPLEKELTNRALLLHLCPDFIERYKVLERTMPDVAEIIQKMLDDNAGALLLNALSQNSKNIDISKYLAGALGRIAEARKFDKQRREVFIQSNVENLNVDFKNIYDSEKINGMSYFEQFKADLIALALARFSKRENPSENLYKFLKEIGQTQEHSADNLFGEEYATTLWDNLLKINRMDLENGEDAITFNIKKILEREKEYLAYKQKRELTEQQLEQFAFQNELLSSEKGRSALQFAMQAKMFGTQTEQNIAQQILAKEGYYLGENGALSLIEGKAKPQNPIDIIREQTLRLYGDETPFMQQMREGFANNENHQKWWIVPRGERAVVEYVKEIDPSLVSFENMEVGNWFADFQGIVHKIAFKNQGTLMLEHYVSQDIAPAKTWIHQNESMRQIINLAHNGEVLLVDTLNKDNTRTIVAKQNGKVITTTIDENGTKETKEEAAKNIELFSRFLQEDNGALETKELKSTFQPLSDKEIKEIVSQWDLENPRAQDKIIIEKVSDKEQEQLQQEFKFKNKKQLVREIDAQHIKHSINRHGDDTNNANVSINVDDILEAYPKITKDFDKRVVTNNNTIIYAKQINGHFVAIEEALVGQDKLRFVTAWKTHGKLNEEVLFKNVKAFPNRQDVHKVASVERNLELSQDGTSHNQSLDIANSTPQNINNSLKNSEPVENAAEGNVVSKSSIAALEKRHKELYDEIKPLMLQSGQLQDSLKEHGTEAMRKQYSDLQSRIEELNQQAFELEKQIRQDKETLFRNTYTTLDSVDEAMRSLAAKLHETRPLEREIGELEKQIEAKSLKLSNNKIKRIIYNDNLNIGVKEYKEKYNKENGIDELRERLEALTKQHSELKKSLEPTQEEWDKLYRLSKEFKVEQELKERREEYASELLEYGYTKEQVENLTQLAETNPLARQIMENYESDTIGHGYSGYSMSNNAINAYENGQKPLSKWTAQDAKDFGEVIGQKVSLKFLKEFLKEFGERGYHHTSKLYNETKFYSLSEALLSSRGREHLEKNLGEILTKAPPAKQNIDNVGAQKAANTSTAAAASDVGEKSPNFFVSREFGEILATRSAKQRLIDNMRALEVLGELAEPPSTEQLAILARYNGFGGLKASNVADEIKTRLTRVAQNDTLARNALSNHTAISNEHIAELLASRIFSNTDNSYFTPYPVIASIYEHLGFVKGRVLETSMGTGNFYTTMPRELYNRVQKVGIELDPISALVGKYLNDDVQVRPMNFYDFHDNLGFDLVIGNPPYGHPILQDFITKAVESAKENGIIVQVVSSTFLDNTASRTARAKIAKNAEFLGAVRLPSDTFSGTNVATDIVVFQKRKGGGDSAFVGTAQHNVGTQSLALNDYYHAHPEHILGDLRIIDTNYNGKRWSVDSNGSIARLPDVLESIFKNRFGSSDAIMGNAEQQDIRRYTGKARNGSLVAVGENVYVVRAGDRFTRNLEEIDWADRIRGKSFEALSDVGQRKRLSDSKKAQEMARDYITLRDNLERLRKAEMENDVNMEDYRDQLRECYDYFKRKHCNGDRIAENRIFKVLCVVASLKILIFVIAGIRWGTWQPIGKESREILALSSLRWRSETTNRVW